MISSIRPRTTGFERGTLDRIDELLRLFQRHASSTDAMTDAVDHITGPAIHQLFSRLGSGCESSEAELLEVLGPETLRRLKIHAASVCTPSKPRCDECVVRSFCSSPHGSCSDTPSVLELFSGAGGLGLGFSQAGFSIAGAIEVDRDAAQTFRLNNPGVRVLEQDVATVDLDVLANIGITPGSIDVIAAGPPCQGYSSAGSRDPSDPQNTLYKEVTRIARLLRPKVVLVENVLGLRRVNGVGFERSIQRSLNRSGYRVSVPFRLRATDFGVPQARERLVFAARRSDLGSPITPPEPTHAPYQDDEPANGLPMTPSLQSVLEDLPQLEPGVSLEHGEWNGGTIANASTMNHSPKVVQKIAAIAQGGGPISYRRLNDDVARTLVAGHRALPVHPTLNRSISVREAARIQGFPDEFVFAGCRSNQPLQVANAVPPPMAFALALHLRKFLRVDDQCHE